MVCIPTLSTASWFSAFSSWFKRGNQRVTQQQVPSVQPDILNAEVKAYLDRITSNPEREYHMKRQFDKITTNSGYLIGYTPTHNFNDKHAGTYTTLESVLVFQEKEEEALRLFFTEHKNFWKDPQLVRLFRGFQRSKELRNLQSCLVSKMKEEMSANGQNAQEQFSNRDNGKVIFPNSGPGCIGQYSEEYNFPQKPKKRLLFSGDCEAAQHIVTDFQKKKKDNREPVFFITDIELCSNNDPYKRIHSTIHS